MNGVVIAFPGDWVGARRVANGRSPVEAQVERITALLDELEGVSLASADVSLMLTEARATICKMEERLASRGLNHATPSGVIEDEGDPQPHVDREVLERHFQSLDG
jgi:hypothetical protein